MMTWLHVLNHYSGQFKHARVVAMGTVALLVVVGGGLGYRWWSQYRTEHAHAELAKAIELFGRAEKENTANVWEEADRSFAQGYAQYASTSLAPYFLVFQSEIAARQGNSTKARTLLENALQAMSTRTPGYGAYAVKLALVQMDSAETAVVEKGKQGLQSIANDAHNPDRNMAIYYQGLHTFERGDRAAAEKIWQPLFGSQAADSLWSQFAQAKLDYLA